MLAPPARPAVSPEGYGVDVNVQAFGGRQIGAHFSQAPPPVRSRR